MLGPSSASMSCYSYEVLGEAKDPLLKSVDVTVVLMMQGSSRFSYDPFLLNLSKKTIVQYNRGFRACAKPPSVVSSLQDITHAYYTAFQYTTQYENVLFLEEDAQVLYYDKTHYEIVDTYLSTRRAKDDAIFSFGSIGSFTRIDKNFYWVWFAKNAQAHIVSRSRRTLIMKQMEFDDFRHAYDAVYFKGGVVTYKRPLIVQLQPVTENMRNWPGNFYLHRLGIKIMGIDRNLSGWERVYVYSKLRGLCASSEWLAVLGIGSRGVVRRHARLMRGSRAAHASDVFTSTSARLRACAARTRTRPRGRAFFLFSGVG